MRLITIAFILLTSSPVFSAPVTWSFNNVTFVTQPDAIEADNGFLSGSFDFDADLGEYSNINISVSPYLYFTSEGGDWLYGYTQEYGGGYDGIYFNHLSFFGAGATGGSFGSSDYYSGDDDYMLILNYAGALTNAGGTVALTSGGILEGPGRNIAGGFVSANVVPIPAAVWLFGSALAGLGWMRRKQTG